MGCQNISIIYFVILNFIFLKEKLYFLESKQQFLSIEELCEHYHKNVLPGDTTQMNLQLEIPLKVKMQKAN